MIKPPRPIDETARLVGLHALRILDTAPEERYDRVTRLVQRIFDVDTCLISLVDDHRQWFKSKQGLDACETDREVSFCGHAILDDQTLIVEDAGLDPRFADNPLVIGEPFIRFYAGCPIHGPSGHRVGTLCLIDSCPRTFSEKADAVLRDMAAMVEEELRLSSQATVDSLTQVANRRGFETVATHMLALCQRTGTSAELLAFDLDGFKQLNDTLGHAAGDRVLETFAQSLLKCFRDADVVARLGGDEFVVLMTGSRGCSHTALSRLAEMGTGIDWSVGRAQYDPDRHDSIESLLEEADARLYEDKFARKQAAR